MRWSGCRRWRGRRLAVVEIHLGRLSCPLFGLEVRIIPRESAEARYQTIREQRNIRVVVLDRIVIALALYGNAILGSRKFILQPLEILIGLQLWVVLHDHQQSAQR